jgi:type II secretory pathway component PulK
MVLVLVLIVVALMSLAGYTFTEMMLAEEEAAQITGRQAQAQCLADSGLETVRMFLAQTPDVQLDAGGHYDNPDRFRGVVVVDDALPYNRGRFTLLAPLFAEGNPPGLRFGLEDESCRLNLNMLLEADKVAENGGRTLLMGLPGMTEEIADAILDYIDTDDEPREFGAEAEEYTTLDPPYEPKNGPLVTV